jgi:hypothetical protein
MIKYIVSFVFGVYIGQEYGSLVPNVKNRTIEALKQIKESDFYKEVIDPKSKP